MTLSSSDIAFIEANPSAAMITVAADSTAKAARVVLAIVDGKLWSAGTVDRARTRRLHGDPRSTLFVFECGQGYRSLETTVTIIDGQAGIDANVRLFRKLQGRPEGPIEFFGTEYDEEAFRAALIADGRIVYEFNVLRSSGVDKPLTEAPTLNSRSGSLIRHAKPTDKTALSGAQRLPTMAVASGRATLRSDTSAETCENAAVAGCLGTSSRAAELGRGSP